MTPWPPLACDWGPQDRKLGNWTKNETKQQQQQPDTHTSHDWEQILALVSMGGMCLSILKVDFKFT